MTNSTSTQKSEASSVEAGRKKITPWRCLFGATISGAFAIGLYFMTTSIAQTFAAKPIHSTNPIVMNISVAVRTLVVGITALGTFVFGLVAVGLVALAIQLSVQSLKQHFMSSSEN
ncbi:MAG: DUF3082 domain-containing protein [Xenococcaceae cyanobacterium]